MYEKEIYEEETRLGRTKYKIFKKKKNILELKTF